MLLCIRAYHTFGYSWSNLKNYENNNFPCMLTLIRVALTIPNEFTSFSWEKSTFLKRTTSKSVGRLYSFVLNFDLEETSVIKKLSLPICRVYFGVHMLPCNSTTHGFELELLQNFYKNIEIFEIVDLAYSQNGPGSSFGSASEFASF